MSIIHADKNVADIERICKELCTRVAANKDEALIAFLSVNANKVSRKILKRDNLIALCNVTMKYKARTSSQSASDVKNSHDFQCAIHRRYARKYNCAVATKSACLFNVDASVSEEKHFFNALVVSKYALAILKRYSKKIAKHNAK